MQPEIQVVTRDEDVYAAPDAARIGTVEDLTEGSVFNPIGGDAASIGN